LIDFQPTGSVIGAVVSGLSLAQTLSPDAIAQIEEALEVYGVLIFPNQDITAAQQVAFSKAFATLEQTGRIAARHAAHPEIFVIGNVDGKLVSFAPALGSDELEWHADHMHLEAPARASLLHCLETPNEGGKTLFACMYGAYDALSAAEKSKADGLVACHSAGGLQSFLRTKGDEGAADGEYAFPEALTVEWPLVRSHPRSGRKSLYFGSKVTVGIKGWEADTARDYLDALEVKATAVPLRYAHKWAVGDAVLWDNRRVLHAGTPYDLSASSRRMHRTTWREDKPII
jgi:taurine dioxygenase